ncbi:MAG: type VI secretion system tube protein TssD [Janthinobacterium lividum]
MASFYAELHVEGGSYRVVHCSYNSYQATDARGRVNAKVRNSPLELVLDVPTDDLLLNWATAAHKPLAGEVIFYDIAGQVAYETIAFTGGECVQYSEQFASSATGDGAYVCHLTITASSFELRAGGPATVLATSEERPTAGAPAVAPAAVVARETTPASEESFASLVARPDAAPTLSPGLAAMLSSTIQVAATAGPGGPANFANAVHTDLQAIYDTPTGRQLLDSLHASGKKIYIHYAPKNSIELSNHNWTRAFYDLDGVTPGAGLGVGVNYNPTLAKAGEMPWNTRPPGIGLAHELIHAEQAAYGRMRRFDTANPGGPDARNPAKPLQVPHYELETIGVHPKHSYAYTENKLRAEWNPPQGRRDYY